MKTIVSLFVLLLGVSSGFSQDITGQWNGVLKVGEIRLRLVFNINRSEAGFTSTMDSPDQGAKGIPVTITSFENSRLQLTIAGAKIEYTGVLKDSILSGTFKQAGLEFPLDLTKKAIEAPKRPQEPAKPYSYYTEEVSFKNPKANISLGGTLTLPKKEGNYPAVILISGSGPQNRDEEIFGHKPFLVLADHLTKNGIAVLRFDDRGVGKSEGEFRTATTVDFVSDVESAVAYLKTRKEINKQKIGLVGHSEGGMIAPQLAGRSADVKYIVLLAAPGIPGHKLMLLQKEKIERKMGYPEAQVGASQDLFKGAYDIILKAPAGDSTLSSQIRTYFESRPGEKIPEDQLNSIVKQLSNPWMAGLLRYDPAAVFGKIKIPVLALNGEEDLQVPTQENLAGIKNALSGAGNKNVTVKAYPGLNHMFQHCKTCQVTEYGQLEETFSQEALNDISAWIISQTSRK